MGFLRFLGKAKDAKKADDLDVPPAPPSSLDFSDFDKEFSAPLPGDDMSSQLGSYPDMPPIPEEPEKGQNQFKEDFPGFPPQESAPRFDDSMFNDGPAPPEPSRLPSFLSKGPAPSQPQAASSSDPRPEHHSMKGSVYVSVDGYRQMMRDITVIRSDLRKASLGLTSMLGTIAQREKDYARYKNHLNDIQKKLVFADKTLFSR